MKQTAGLQLELLSPPQQTQSSLEFSSKRISTFILNILESEIDIHQVAQGFALDVPQMGSKQYEEFKGVIASLKGKWTGKTHLFDYDPTRLLKEVIASGKVPKTNPYHFFETPDPEIDDLFTLMDLPEGEEWELSLLEPSCGRGAIARKLRERLPNSTLDVVEIDPLNQEKLRLNGFNLIGSDFMDTRFKKRYDFIVSNPPFDGMTYIDHLEKQFNLLKPHGKLGAIAPEGMLTGNSKRVVDFRNFVAERCHWEFIGSPFKDTPTKCIALTIENLSIAEIQKRWEPTNGYESSFQESLEIALGCDRQWHEIVSAAKDEPEERLEQFLGDALDSRISQFIQKDRECFFYDQKVKSQLLRSALGALRDG
jgi:Methyltransferase small domain